MFGIMLLVWPVDIRSMFIKCQVKTDIDVHVDYDKKFDFKTKDISIAFGKNRMVRNTLTVKIEICNYISKRDPAWLIPFDKWIDYNIVS